MGCGLIGKAQQVVGAAKILSDFSDRLGERPEAHLHRRRTRWTGGDPVTLTQQPPNSAYIGKTGRFIFTRRPCTCAAPRTAVLTCQKSAPTSGRRRRAATPAWWPGSAGPGFVSPALALGLIAAAVLVPGAKVDESNKTIAGQSSRARQRPTWTPPPARATRTRRKDFTVCVTDGGVLASFTGTDTAGRSRHGDRTDQYSTTADPKSFRRRPAPRSSTSTRSRPADRSDVRTPASPADVRSR